MKCIRLARAFAPNHVTPSGSGIAKSEATCNPIVKPVKIGRAPQRKADAPKATCVPNQEGIEAIERRLPDVNSRLLTNRVKEVVNALV
jgi:hypothetical protein